MDLISAAVAVVSVVTNGHSKFVIAGRPCGRGDCLFASLEKCALHSIADHRLKVAHEAIQSAGLDSVELSDLVADLLKAESRVMIDALCWADGRVCRW
jgi:hypothetical protein